MKKAGQILVGFAAETEDIVNNAVKKIASKNLDMIVCNDVLAKGSGFSSDTNTILIITPEGVEAEFSGSKEDAADVILDAVVRRKSKL